MITIPMLRSLLTATLLATLFTSPLQAQTLFTYGGKPVSVQSFQKAFIKNPGDGDRRKAMEEYLPLYINYVLKVQDAYDNQLDTLAGQRDEIAMYKRQLAEGYLAERSGVDHLVKEVMDRMQQDVQLGHIYIEYANNDTAAAMATARQCVAALKAGKSWADAAVQYSNDAGVKAAKGNAGWITTFSIPYDYETLVWELPKGGYTQPVKASSGVHIFSKLNTRPGSGYIQVAQILVADMQGLSETDRNQRARLADSLYNLLKGGADMNYLVAMYSQDRTSNQAAGLLPPFGIGTYEPAFEEAAFSLRNAGDITPPVRTSMGWHILKLVRRFPLPTPDDAIAYNELKQKVIADGRAEKAKDNYVRKQLPAMKYKPSPITLQQLQQYTDSLLKGSQVAAAGIREKAIVFSFDKQPYYIEDWVAFARVQSMAGKLAAGAPIQKPWDDFIVSKANDHLLGHLDEVDKDFAAQFKEFKDANLLFEAMERNVWSKAMNDSTGLQNWYEGNKEKYTWKDNITGIMVTGQDSVFVHEAFAALKDDHSKWRDLNVIFGDLLFADSGRYEIAILPLPEGAELKAGTCTSPLRNQLDGSFSFMCIVDKEKAGRPRSFDEARGYAMSDFQQKIEDAWIGRLKKKYPVKMNEAEWKKLLASAK
ncbi:MAG TPA: peptidylprolyl isomerase [Phnomibacter sp.]|nr:peptidylprolyl isomerase [Phnomibacter sp.]